MPQVAIKRVYEVTIEQVRNELHVVRETAVVQVRATSHDEAHTLVENNIDAVAAEVERWESPHRLVAHKDVRERRVLDVQTSRAGWWEYEAG